MFVLLSEIRHCINDDHLMAAQRKVLAVETILKASALPPPVAPIERGEKLNPYPSALPSPVEPPPQGETDDLSRVDRSALSGPTGSTAREQPDGSQHCTCLSISRDPLCWYHGDVDKVTALFPERLAR
jgi:hypothetical protein